MSKLSKLGHTIERGIGSVIPHEGAASRRMKMAAAKEQIDLYHEQKASLQREEARVAGEKKTEADKLHSEQLRSLRRAYRRPGGFMGSTDGEPKKTLG